MLGRLFGKSAERKAALALHAEIVQAGRRPVFYAELGVPDTVDGRFELIILHAALLMRRLRAGDEQARKVSQLVFDALFKDFDFAMRETGVGDGVMAKKIKAMAQAFYGRAQSYDQALEAEESSELVEAVERNVFAGEAGDGARLAAWIRSAVESLEGRAIEQLIAGGPIEFPEP